MHSTTLATTHRTMSQTALASQARRAPLAVASQSAVNARTGRALVLSGFVLVATALVALVVGALAAQRGAEWLLAPAAILGAFAVRLGEKFCGALVKAARG